MATRYDCRTAGFMDDVMFSHNGANRPESKMARMFCPVRLVAAPVGRQITFARLAALGAKSAVSECILLQVFFFCFPSVRKSKCNAYITEISISGEETHPQSPPLQLSAIQPLISYLPYALL